jgi:release factor H-coupled RctB family protein
MHRRFAHIATMPSTRITIISNANQTLRVTFLLTSSSRPAILKAAKDKLRLKKPSRIFLSGGNEIPDEQTLIKYLQNGVEFHVSCGEDFIGIRQVDVSALDAADVDVRVISKESFVDPVSVTQLKATTGMRGMIQVVGMPDLHPGLKYPVGAAFVTENWIHPPLLGGDVGCGMAVFRIPSFKDDLADSEVKKLAERLVGIEGPWEGDVPTFLSRYLSPQEIAQATKWESSLGTIGGGNHFAELQQITESKTDDFAADEVVLVVHSGSRGLGQQILAESEEEYEADSPGGEEYLRIHDMTCRWAKANRDLIALRFLRRLLKKPELSIDAILPHKVLDIWHNDVEHREEDGTFIHRKGAAPATAGVVIIPGSRGTLSAYVKPISTASTAYSLAHGAGRAQSRTATFKKLTKRYKPADLRRTKLGGWVICEDRELIFEEAPEGYKEIEPVVQDLVEEGACEVIAWGMPRISYKVRIDGN